MRVLFISHQANYSGAPYALLQELRHICQHCNDIHPIVLVLSGGELESDFRCLCPTIYWNNFLLKVVRKCHLERLIQKFYPIDCIYANSIVSLDVALIIKGRLQIPLIMHTHESESYLRGYVKTAGHLEEVDYFITVSELSKRCLVRKHEIRDDKVVIQRPFSPWVVKAIEESALKPSTDKKDGDIVIGTICNGTWQKAPELIAIVTNFFFKRYPNANCKFMVAGIDKESDAYYHIAYDLERMHLVDKVLFLGRVERPLECYPLFDVFLLLSREESFSLVAEEAAICGLPIVGFEGATGATEWIKDRCGILVPYMDLNAMVDAIYELYSYEKRRKELGQNARSIITKMYNEESQMEKVINVLYSVIREKCFVR